MKAFDCMVLHIFFCNQFTLLQSVVERLNTQIIGCKGATYEF